MKPIVRFGIVMVGGMFVLAGCALLALRALDPDMRGPRGYYVQVEDRSVFIEFFEKPRARSNVVKDFGEADYLFSASDGEINLSGPIAAPKELQRYYSIVGEDEDLRVQDLSADPGPGRVFPVTRYKRQKK